MLMHSAPHPTRVPNAHPKRVREASTHPEKVLLTLQRVSKTIFSKNVCANISFSAAC